MKSIEIYTDGACSGNPGPGGWGAILIYGDHRKELSGSDPDTTNNRMEMMAAIQAIKSVKESCKIALHTDSAYLCRAFTEHWINGWLKNNWKTASKKPVENQDLWQALLDCTKSHEICWIKVKGHANNELNNRCDELARAAINQAGNIAIR
ncbi:MAG: ribonuclease HI [Clostridia bacterium]